MPCPIPGSLRGSTVAVRVPVDSEFGGEYAEPVEIEGVRFQPAETMPRSAYVLSDGAKGLLWVDATSGGAFEVPAGSLLSIDGGAWASAGKVTRCVAFGNDVHHWEIEVM